MKKRIFVSSVQREFASLRKQLASMIRGDRWLRSFFEVFLFEEECARSLSAQKVYLDAVAAADICIGIIGDEYGNADAEGVSPTEREFDRATELHKDRLVFVRKNAAKRQTAEASAMVRVKLFASALSMALPSLSLNRVRDSFTQFSGARDMGLKDLLIEARAKCARQQARVDRPESQARVTGQGHRQGAIVARIASVLFREECSRSQLAQRINVSVQAGWFKAKIQSLLDDGLIERTIPDKPNSRLQKYRLTGKGRQTFKKGV